MINFVRRGNGEPLLLIHGLGGSWRSWSPILPALERERDVIAIDLPGHGESPADADSRRSMGLADAVEPFLDENGLRGVDIVGSSLGARIALEMARRGAAGATVALDPGGFWRGHERRYFSVTIGLSGRLARRLKPILPRVAASGIARRILLVQISAKPGDLDPALVEGELRSFAETSTFDALVRDLAYGPRQEGPAAPDSGPVTIGWGRRDLVCFPRQAKRAVAVFPGARLHWFEKCGHFPMWDQPDETVRLILEATGRRTPT